MERDKNNTKINDQAISNACDELKDVLIRKNHDYGDSFGQTFKELGPISGLTRFTDKYNRLKQLLTTNNKQEVNDESILDTWQDAAGYAILNLIETKRQQHRLK